MLFTTVSTWGGPTQEMICAVSVSAVLWGNWRREERGLDGGREGAGVSRAGDPGEAGERGEPGCRCHVS